MIDVQGKSLQQISDEIAEALIRQGVQCRNNITDLCVYGNSEGQHCAVGMIIPEDEVWAFEVEGQVYNLLNYGYVRFETGHRDTPFWFSFLNENKEFFNLIQHLHDTSSVSSRKVFAERVSELYKIDMKAWDDWINLGGSEQIQQ